MSILNQIIVNNSYVPIGTFETTNLTLFNSRVKPYLRNVYIIPETLEKFEYLKTLGQDKIYLTYLGVRDNNFGRDNSNFGIQLSISKSGGGVASFYITEVPDLSKYNIVELKYKANASGEIATGFRIFVDFN